jgi:hypothetical protein
MHEKRDSFRDGGHRQHDDQIRRTLIEGATEITSAGRLPACSRPLSRIEIEEPDLAPGGAQKGHSSTSPSPVVI